MLDLVPLARPRREVTDRQPQAERIGQRLQRHLPQPRPTAVRPAGVRQDQELLGPRVGRAPHLPPPPADRLGGELSRVVVDAHTHPPLIQRDVVNPRRRGLPQVLVRDVLGPGLVGGGRPRALFREVLPPPPGGGARRLPRPAGVPEIPINSRFFESTDTTGCPR